MGLSLAKVRPGVRLVRIPLFLYPRSFFFLSRFYRTLAFSHLIPFPGRNYSIRSLNAHLDSPFDARGARELKATSESGEKKIERAVTQVEFHWNLKNVGKKYCKR